MFVLTVAPARYEHRRADVHAYAVIFEEIVGVTVACVIEHSVETAPAEIPA
jgi:hypothetical protein